MRPAEPAGGERCDEGRDWHIGRARGELDAAYRAAGAREAALHFRLCSLHLERAGWRRRGEAAGEHEAEWMRRCRPLHERALAG